MPPLYGFFARFCRDCKNELTKSADSGKIFRASRLYGCVREISHEDSPGTAGQDNG